MYFLLSYLNVLSRNVVNFDMSCIKDDGIKLSKKGNKVFFNVDYKSVSYFKAFFEYPGYTYINIENEISKLEIRNSILLFADLYSFIMLFSIWFFVFNSDVILALIFSIIILVSIFLMLWLVLVRDFNLLKKLIR
jgi:hypothetical protein